jgi:hypothetical protein
MGALLAAPMAFQIAGLVVQLLGVAVPEVDRVVARQEQCCCKTVIIRQYVMMKGKHK